MSSGQAGAEAQAERRRLKGASIGGVLINMASQVVRTLLRLGYQIVIARLLLPGDFGLVAMAAPVITFVQLFADLGLSQATVQQSEISQGQLSFLFWLNVAAGLLLSAVCVGAAPLVARFYGDPRVTGVMIAAGALLLLGSFYSQHMALLNRHMRFRALAVVDIASFLLGSAGGIAAALLGAGYWAIIANQAVTTVSALVMVWRASGWVPGRPGRFSEMTALMHFGGNVTSFNFVNFFSRNGDNILIGRFAGEHALGLYDRAFKLMLVPFGQIAAPFGKVAVPLLSRSHDQPEFYRQAYRRMLEAVLLLLYPGLVFMIAAHRALIALALGPRWADVAPIFAILGFNAFVAPIGSSMGWLFVSQGRTREMRNCGIVASAIFVGCFVVGLRWGPLGVAAGYMVAGFIEISFLWRIATRKGPLGGRDFFATILPFVLAVLFSFAVLAGLRPFLPPGLAGLMLQAVCAYAAFFAALAALPGGRHVLRGAFRQLAALVKRFRPVAAGKP